MSREIEFRAWVPHQEGFINGFNMIGFSTGQGAPKRKLQRFSNEWNIEDVVLMQWTGFYDKHAVKIFEGDLVTTQQYNQSCWDREAFESGKYDVRVVKWGNGAWELPGRDGTVPSGIGLKEGTAGRFTVIGNICKNNSF